jgi:hypothetical protein
VLRCRDRRRSGAGGGQGGRQGLRHWRLGRRLPCGGGCRARRGRARGRAPDLQQLQQVVDLIAVRGGC